LPQDAVSQDEDLADFPEEPAPGPEEKLPEFSAEPDARGEAGEFSGFSGDTEELDEVELADEQGQYPEMEFADEREQHDELGFGSENGEEEISVFALRPADEPPPPEQPTRILQPP